MNYTEWTSALFAHPEGSDPVATDLPQQFYQVPKSLALDFVDRMLADASLHEEYSQDQLGFGLNVVYSNSCSDVPFCYVDGAPEPRRVEAVRNLQLLYEHYFSRYCPAEVSGIGEDASDPMQYLCYMFWDIFVLYPKNTTSHVVDAALKVMKQALHSTNESCVVSAIHGLGHWAIYSPPASAILDAWLQQPSTNNTEIANYAQQAKSGCIQ